MPHILQLYKEAQLKGLLGPRMVVATPHPSKEPLMPVLSDLATALQTLLTEDAEAAARATGCVRRRRRFSGATFVQTLVLGWLQAPRAPVDELVDVAADLGVD